MPTPEGRELEEPYSVYLKAHLFHAGGDKKWKSSSVKTGGNMGMDGADVMWKESFEWWLDADELAFLRQGESFGCSPRSDLAVDYRYMTINTPVTASLSFSVLSWTTYNRGGASFACWI